MVCRVVLVDDNEEFRSVARELVGSDNGFCIVAEAGTGEDAVERILEFHPDLIVLDVDLGDVDGFGVIRTVRQAGCETPVIFISMHDSLAHLAAAGNAGAAAYILKERMFEDLLPAMAGFRS